jgi:hypothetical protein
MAGSSPYTAEHGQIELIGVVAALLACVGYKVSSVLQAYGACRSSAAAQGTGATGHVTANGGVAVLGIGLHARDWLAIVAVIVSLFVLGLTAGDRGGGTSDPVVHWGFCRDRR